MNSYNFIDNLNPIYIKKGLSLKVSECQFSYWKQTAHFNDTNYNEGIVADSCGGVRIWHNGFRFSCDTCCYIDIAHSGANTDPSMIHGNVFRDTANNADYVVGNKFTGNNDYMGITCNAYRGMMIDWLIDSNATLMSPQGYFGNVNKSAKKSFDTFDLVVCPTCYNIKKLNGSAIYYNYSPEDVGLISYPLPYQNQHLIYTLLGDPTPCDTLNCGGWLSAISDPTNMLAGGCWIWPNPAQDELNVYFAEVNQTRRIFVYDMQGRELLQKTIIKGVNYTTMDLSSIPQGVYFYNVKTETGQGFNGKVVIIKP